jgi:hypothetical protein
MENKEPEVNQEKKVKVVLPA